MEQFNFGPAKKQLPSFTGASGVTGGSSGLVPAPAAGDDGKCLMGDGTWGVVDALPTVTPSDNGKVLKVASGDWSVEDEQDISGLAPKASPVFTGSISLGRKANTTVGSNSIATGSKSTASGADSHAEGYNTSAINDNAHAEGYSTTASGAQSHAEGNITTASAIGSHAEGNTTTASGQFSHAEGNLTIASGPQSHAEGLGGIGYGALGKADHAEGYNTIANSGSSNTVYGAHAEGSATTASADSAHAEGKQTVASGVFSHAEGVATVSGGQGSHAEGQGGTYTESGTTKYYGAYGTADHSEGFMTLTAQGQPGNHAEGYMTKATGGAAHSEGAETVASGNASHAEGGTTTASGARSHSEGENTTASGNHSHAEGKGVTASAYASHAEGLYTISSGAYSHASGAFNVEDSYGNWPEWIANTYYDVGDKVKLLSGSSFKGFICKTANSDSIFSDSKWIDQSGKMNYAEIIGNGTDNSARSNARTLDWDGNERLMGDIYVGCNADSTGGTKLQNATVMTGATGSTGGSAGLVPAPSATDNEKYLRGDGTWQTTPYPSTMTGATGSTGGSAGLVPSPAAGDEGKYLKGDGTWGAITSYNRQFWTSAQSASVSLAADGKTYLIWTAGSSAGTLGAMMDTTNGAVVIVSNGEYAVLHKGSGITVSVANDELTVAASTGIKMAIVEL